VSFIVFVASFRVPGQRIDGETVMCGVPAKGAVGGGGFSLTAVAVGSWIVASAGLILLGSVLVFLSAWAWRS
jgi:hypothetical protein